MRRFRQYLDLLARVNGLGGPVEWLFFPGMLAESRAKWWGDFRVRHATHEGIDICFYKQGNGPVRRLGPETRIPALADGRIVNMCPDFLGTTLVAAHDGFSGTNTRVVFAYSHLAPAEGTAVGNRIEKGQTIARVFNTADKGSILLPHLHLSCIEVPGDTRDQDLDWRLFPFRDKVSLINPVFL